MPEMTAPPVSSSIQLRTFPDSNGFFAPASGPDNQQASMTEKLWSRNFIIACLSYFLIACIFSLLMPTIPIFLSEELDVEPTKIGIVLSSYVLALLLFRPFSGFLVDSYARKPLLLFGTIMFVSIFIGYYFAFTVLFFIVLRFFHGLFWGLATVSANTVAIDIIPSSRRAEGIGYFGVNTNLAMAFAPFIGVKIYEGYGFHALISAALIMGFLAIVAAAFIKVPDREPLPEHAPISLDRFILVKAIPILFNHVPGLRLARWWPSLCFTATRWVFPTRIFSLPAGGVVLSRVASGSWWTAATCTV